MILDLNVEQAKNEAAQLRELIKRIDNTGVFKEDSKGDIKAWLELDKEEAAIVMAALMLAHDSCANFIQAAEAAKRKVEQ